MNTIGFNQTDNNQTKNADEIIVKVVNVDKEFTSMLKNLDMEEKLLVKELELEKEVRKSLVKLHKKIKKLEKDADTYQKLMSKVGALMQDSPKECLEILNKAEQLAFEIAPKAGKIYEELKQHQIRKFDEIYQDIELTKAQTDHIRALAKTLNQKLGRLMDPINRMTQSQEGDAYRRNIFASHPELK